MQESIFGTICIASPKLNDEQVKRWLVQIHPLDLEQNRIELGKAPVMLGRSQQCDVVLEDESVSRQHAQISWSPTGFEIADQGSTNGVLVNEKPVKASLLKTGDRIQLGQRIFRFLADNDVENQYHETVYSMMTRDGLTSVFNKRYLLECLDREVARSRRHQRSLAVVLLDIDHFKTVNDTWGHLVGDEVLRELASRLTGILREDEILARFGGEEFAIVDGESTLEAAREMAERCRRVVAGTPFTTACGPLDVTISLGVAAKIFDEKTSAESILSDADARLYDAKRNGRNQVAG